MKRCATCNRTYIEPTLSFCIDDGTPLIAVDADDDETVVNVRERESGANEAAYQPPAPYVPPVAQPARKRAWPWVVGLLGAFLLGILAIGIVAAILVPRMLRRDETSGAVANTNQSREANSAAEENANTNGSETVDAKPSTNRQLVLSQLTEIEHEWTVANLNADKRKLDRILADDFVAKAPQGQLESKADYIGTIQRDTTVEKWEFEDLKVTLAGDRATLTGIITYFFFESRSETFDFTDKFVWRDGRWQATGSEVSRRRDSETDL